MTDEEIRVGVIGAGTNTRERHIPGLQAIDGVTIVGVCNRSRASSQAVADEFGIAKTYDKWPEAVADADTNAIVIGTWPYLHCEATLAVIDAGKHVLVEARMAMNAPEARAMRDAARARPELTTQVVPSPMTLAVDRTIRRRVEEGRLGRLLAIEIRGGGDWLDADAPMHWRQDVELSGLNTLSLGIWYEAVMRWVGPATSLMAMGRIFVTTRADADGRMRPVKVPDHLDVLAEMECGAQLHMQLSAVTALAGPGEAMLFGSEGTLRYCDGKLFGADRGEPKLSPIEIPDVERGRWRVEEEFVGAIRGREPIRLTSFEDGLRYMEFTEAVAGSIATGRATPVSTDRPAT